MNNQLFFESDIEPKLFDLCQQEVSAIGYYALPDQNIDPILSFATNNTKTHIVVIGIGGSSLGAKAVYSFVGLAGCRDDRQLHFLESTDPITLRTRMGQIDWDDALVLVISKSGSTIETTAIFKYVTTRLPLSPDHYVMVTDKGSPLEALAHHYALPLFYIPSNVGGRFSVLSAVGLLPLALVGVDIQALLEGAKEVKDDFFAKRGRYTALMKKATYYARNYTRTNINAIFSYAEIFRHFNEWYVQLWGESLGKYQRHSALSIGLTPIGLIGPTDQHSFLQLIVEGPRDKTVTFIKIANFHDDLTIPAVDLDPIGGHTLLDGVFFSDLINMQADAIIQQLTALHIPLDVIELERADAKNIGALMFTYELLTSLVALMLDIHAYDQPGVEGGKIILKSMLKNQQTT